MGGRRRGLLLEVLALWWWIPSRFIPIVHIVESKILYFSDFADGWLGDRSSIATSGDLWSSSLSGVLT